MGSLPYTLDIPLRTNSPSVDQPNMKVNTNSINSILDVDLYNFGSNFAGQHKQMTLPDQNVPGPQTDPQAVYYTNTGTASPVSDAFFVNQNATFLLSCVRAFGVFVGGSGVLTLLNGYNVVSISGSTAQIYTITLTTNCVTGNNACILTKCFAAPTELDTFPSLASPVLTVFTSKPSSGYTISFLILQA